MGYFKDNTVEIEFEGKKVRVSKNIAEIIAKKSKSTKKEKQVKEEK